MEKLVALAKVDWYDEYEEDAAQRTKTDYIVLTSITSFDENTFSRKYISLLLNTYIL